MVLAKLKEGLVSPYRNIRLNNNNNSVNYLLLKFVNITPSNDKDIQDIKPEDVQREIDIQQEIYHKSLRHPNTLLEPICPCIVYSHAEKLEPEFKNSFYTIIQQSTHHKQIQQVFQGDVEFFAMEFMEGYQPFASFEETPEMFLKAAKHAELDNMRGVSANVMCGQEGYFGTSAFQVVLDIDKITQINSEEWKEENDELEIQNKFDEFVNKDLICSIANLTIQSNVMNIAEEDLGEDNGYQLGF